MSVTHRRLGGQNGSGTACGLWGIGHRPIKYTDDDAKTTCTNCLLVLKRRKRRATKEWVNMLLPNVK